MSTDTTMAARPINPDTNEPEGKFRRTVRDILNLDPFTRDQAIFDALRRLVDVAGVAHEVRS